MSQIESGHVEVLTPSNSNTNAREIKMINTYTKEARNARAVVQTSSWLSAVGIENDLSQTPGADLVIKAKDGRQVEIKLALDDSEPRPAECIVINARELTSKHMAVALKAFHTITEATGHGAPVPVDRGQRPEHKLSCTDNPELVTLRHNEFRRVPNPDVKELLQYKPVMLQACYSFMNLPWNKDFFRRHGIGVDDLMSYAMSWTVIYLGLYKVMKETNNDNVRKLRKFLKQRFVELFKTWGRKEANILPSPDTVHLCLLGRPLDENHRLEGFSYNPIDEAIDASEDEIVAEGVEASEDSRRLAATRLLQDKLGALPHDQMLQALKAAAENKHLNIAARHEAGKRLRLHQQSCEACGGSKPAVTNPAQENHMDPNGSTPENNVAAEAPKKRAARASHSDLFPVERAAFLATLAAERECPKCHAKKPVEEGFGIRLMNGTDAAAGAKPNYRVQSLCRCCRSTKG